VRNAHLVIVAMTAALLVGACSSSSSTTAPSAAAPSAAPTAAASAGGGGASSTAAVSIKNFAFNPTPITVSSGGTVNWTNDDTTTHTVTFDDASITSSGNVDAGGKFSATFAKAGSYTYHCKIHPTMLGTVTVS